VTVFDVLVLSPRAEAIASRLCDPGTQATPAATRDEALRLLAAGSFDALVVQTDGDVAAASIPGTPAVRLRYCSVEEADGEMPGRNLVVYDKDPIEPAPLFTLAATIRTLVEIERDTRNLRMSEARYRQIVEAVNEGIRIIDTTDRVTYVNPHGAAMLGYSREELIGENPFEHIIPEDRPQLADEIPRHEQGEAYHFRQIRIRKKDGTSLWIAYNAVPIIEEGVYTGSIAMFSDITSLKDAEEIIRQRTAELEAAYRRLALLSAVTRHDIGNELLTVDGYLRYLAGEEMTPRASRLAEGLTMAIDRIRSIVGFMRDYQAIGVLPPVWLDLRAIADRAATSITSTPIRVENGLPSVELLAAPLIEKVIAHLIENAARHGDGRGTIVRLSAAVEGAWFLILVEDDGESIPAEEKGRIFSQGHGRNAGYGLFFVREALENMGMTIAETGEPGSGVRFEIRVPGERCRAPGR
jgi:PAS domain S-box-containing protein